MEPSESVGAAPEELVARHLPLVRMLAARLYRLRWDNSVRFDEYCQMGAVGLLEAANRYDPARGAQFATYATWRITGAILNGLEQSTEHQQQAGARRRAIQERSASLAEAPAAGGDTLEAALARISEAAIGLAVGFMLDGTGMYSEGNEVTRRDGYASLAMRQLLQRLRDAVRDLPEPERGIVEGHYFQQRPFVDIAAGLALTKGRVSQLHKRAMQRLREMLRDDMIGFDG